MDDDLDGVLHGWDSSMPEDFDSGLAFDDADLERHSAALMAKYFPDELAGDPSLPEDTAMRRSNPFRCLTIATFTFDTFGQICVRLNPANPQLLA